MSLAPSTPKTALDRTPCITGKAEDQPCNVTDDNNLGADCYESMHAFKKIRTSTSGLRKSPNKWTKEENQKLAALVSSYGEKKWKRISAEMGGQKTGAQCAQHWKRVLSPEIRKGHWDENEEDLLLRLVVQYGSCWKKIAKKIPQRTDIQCRYQYLKAKQSREVMWDAKEDESLIKKVMEMANCNFFKIVSDNSANSNTNSIHSLLPGSSYTPTNFPIVSSNLSTNYNFSPNKENEVDNLRESGLGSSTSSDIKEDEDCMKSSGEYSKDGAWNDDRNDVNMSDSSNSSNEATNSNTTTTTTTTTTTFGKATAPAITDNHSLCPNCHSPAGSHVSKVVWLEISEHMARLKLTSTLRTALECKTRFMELLGNKISFSAPHNFCLNNSSPEIIDNKNLGLKNSGGISGAINNSTGIASPDSKSIHNMNDTNISIKINNNNNNINNNFSNDISNINNTTTTTPSGNSNNNINITNCNNNNITINITNSYTTANTNQNGINFQRTISHCTSTPISTLPLKTEHSTSPISLPKSSVPILSPAPPFPSFSHVSLPSFPHIPQPTTLKPARNVPSGLESLAAVASILPREMLADYVQF